MPASLLSDNEIISELKAGRLVVTGVDHDQLDLSKRNCPVQPSSLDLHIGRIFVPPKEPNNSSETNLDPQTGFRLPAGHSVIIETAEEISLAPSLSAFGFPPASLSRSGLLMTNPGHVDPGWSGRLTFTMINMGRDTASLRAGDPLVTLLIFSFDHPVTKGYNDREKEAGVKSSSLHDVLNDLSPDFGNFTSRAEILARQEVKNQRLSLELRKIYIPVIITLATTIAAFFIGKSTNVFSIATEGFVKAEVSDASGPLGSKIEAVGAELETRIRDLEASVNRLQAAGDVLTLDERFDAIEQQLDGIRGQ